MQKIEYKESPSPHVVIDNFLSTQAARKCLEEAQWLEPVYEDATTMGSPQDNDGCEECVALGTTIKSAVRSNKVVYLDRYYENSRYNSMVLSSLKLAVTDPTFVHSMARFPKLFPIVSQTTNMETTLSSYGKCDFYGWHKDAASEQANHRIITLVLHLNTEPQQYVGGELILTGDTIQDQLPYIPKHNRAILFQSNQCLHAVNETTHEGDFKDSRFSVNLWLGFEEPSVQTYKYR